MTLYAARQPILDKDKNLFAYEILFRNGLTNAFPEINEDEATSKIVAGAQFNLGIESLTEDKPAFINFTQDTLMQGYPMLLPPEQVVVEILETVKPSKKLLKVCEELKKKGYTIALDDYEHQAIWQHFYPFTDIIKIDYQLSPLEEIKEVIEAVTPYPHIKLLAEKVETYEEFKQACELGFRYFQGYFFSRPEVIKSTALATNQMSLANLMAEINSDSPDINQVTSVFESDVTLSFKLLRYAQSPIFKRRSTIESIKQAIVALGQDELRRFVSVLFTAEVSSDKPSELTRMSLTRAKFCENIAVLIPKADKSPAFLVGMLSLLDALLDTNLSELVEKLPLTDSVKQALMLDQGLLADLLDCCKLAENADWLALQQSASKLAINEEDLLACYSQAIQWSAQLIKAV